MGDLQRSLGLDILRYVITDIASACRVSVLKGGNAFSMVMLAMR